MLRAMEKSVNIGPVLWRRLAYFFVLICLAGVGLALLGEWMDWSGGVTFAATVIVGAPISLAAVRETVACLREAAQE